MDRCQDLLRRARRAPASLRFREICRLAECFGWVYARQKGSHRLYKRVGSDALMNLQDHHGAARVYQVRQLVRAIDGMEPLDRGRVRERHGQLQSAIGVER